MNKGHISRQRRILLVVPKIVRDLEGHALIAYYLRERFGHEVKLYTGSDTEQVFLDFRPDALVLDYLGWEDRAREARLATSVNAKVCVLPTAGVFPDEDGFLRGAGAPTGACKLVACYLSWGEYAVTALMSRQLIPENRIEMTGCPRFDFYVNTNLAVLQDKRDFLKRIGISNTQAPLILWSTSTNNYNNLYKDPEQYVKGMAEGAGVSEQQLRTELQDECEQMRVHSEAVRSLAKRRPEWNFLIKIHPLENREAYHRLARESKNLFVAPNLAIRQFLFHSDIVLQRGCTTATEAWVLNKPVLELKMGQFQSRWAPPEHAAGNHPVRSIDETENAISYYLNGGSVSAEEQEARQVYLRKFYYRIDGLASLRCAAAINRQVSAPLHTDEDHLDTLRRIERARLQTDRNLGAPMAARIKRSLRISDRRTLRPWKKSFWATGPRVNPKTVAQLYGRYRWADQQRMYGG